MSVVIVTGGTFGIGQAITVTLARRGHQVVAFGLDSPQISSIAANSIAGLRDELKSLGADAHVLEADVSKAAEVAKVVGTVIDVGCFSHQGGLIPSRSR